MADDEFEALSKATDHTFRPFLTALRETGARPKELRELRWDQLQGDRFVIWEHKADATTDKPRVIYLNAVMKELLAKLREDSSSEYVFVNSRGARAAV